MKHTELNSNKLLHLLNNQEITVYEDIQGTKIWCNYHNGKWHIRPKSIKNKPINIIDLAYQKIYKYVYGYLLSLSDDITNIIKPNLYFCFEYFPDHQPANIKYEKIPDNRLILTTINKDGNHYIYNYKQLKAYADLLGVEMLPIIYNGKLSKEQIKSISTYLSMDKKDVTFLNGEPNFAKFFYNLLNPAVKNSYLSNNFQNNLEKIIIRFEKDKKLISLELLNPIYKREEYKIDSNYSDIFSILIFNFLDFITGLDLNNINIEGRTREMLYINFVCELYNLYMDECEEDINKLNFVIPNFFTNDKFKINDALINNDKTKNYLHRSIKNQYLLKIIISTFREKMKKPLGIFTNLTLTYLNNTIRTIHVLIEEKFNYNRKISTYALKDDLSKYNNILWEEDNGGFVKTNKGKLFDKQSDNKKKKKK